MSVIAEVMHNKEDAKHYKVKASHRPVRVVLKS